MDVVSTQAVQRWLGASSGLLADHRLNAAPSCPPPRVLEDRNRYRYRYSPFFSFWFSLVETLPPNPTASLCERWGRGRAHSSLVQSFSLVFTLVLAARLPLRQQQQSRREPRSPRLHLSRAERIASHRIASPVQISLYPKRFSPARVARCQRPYSRLTLSSERRACCTLGNHRSFCIPCCGRFLFILSKGFSSAPSPTIAQDRVASAALNGQRKLVASGPPWWKLDLA